MFTGVIVFLAILFVVTIVGTLFAIKREENNPKVFDKEGDTAGEALKASHKYKPDTPDPPKSIIKPQLIIYGTAIVVAIVATTWFTV